MDHLSHGRLAEIDVDSIKANPYQPRTQFSQEELEELAFSIREFGLIHPPVVRLSENGGYELISGERRYQASKLAGLRKIPVLIRSSTHTVSAQLALIENIQRVDLNPLEVAKALKALVEEFGFSQEDLAQRIGKKRSTVANYLRLLALPKGIQDGLAGNMITMGHAKAILSLDTADQQTLLFELILRDSLSVRQAEESAKRLTEKAKKKTLVYANRDFFLEQLSEKIQERLGTKVFIQGKGRRGRIHIDYYSLDDLDRVLAILGLEAQ